MKRIRARYLIGGVSAVLVVTAGYLVVSRTGSVAGTSTDDSCTATLLSESESTGNMVSPNGEYVLWTIGNSDDGESPQLSRDGTVVDSDMTDYEYPVAVNSSGIVVGDGGGDSGAAVRQDGRWRDLEMPKTIDLGGRTYDADDVRVSAVAINDRGDVVGNATVEQDRAPDVRDWGEITILDSLEWSVPILWPAESGEPQVLTVGDGLTGSAEGLTEDGDVLGSLGPPITDHDADDIYADQDAWLWTSDDAGEEVPHPVFDGQNQLPSENSGDWVLSGQTRWNLTDRKAETVDPGLYPVAIDDNGTVYGGETMGYAPASWDGDRIVEFPLLDGYESGRVTGTNRDGTVLTGYLSNGDDYGERAAMWTCG